MKTNELKLHKDCIELPLVLSRELVVFPHSIVPFVTDSRQSIKAITRAMEEDRLVFFVFPKDDPESEEYHPIGTVVKILQIFKLKDGTIRLVGEAMYRAELCSCHESSEETLFARLDPIRETKQVDEQIELLMQSILSSFDTYVSQLKQFPDEIRKKINEAQYADLLVDLVAAHIPIKKELKLELLLSVDHIDRLQRLLVLLDIEIEMIKLHGEIQKRVKDRLEKTQKEYFLHEQIRQINKELGREQDEADEADELLERIKALTPPEEVIAKATKESNRLRKLQAMSPESGVIRTYLEWLADIPWSKATADNYDIVRAKSVLDEDHYNMIKPKERILDYLAVRSIKKSLKGPILCLVGPPGTGKTSLGKSIARTMGRELVRISLGGVRDEAEIRGHRKTYVGALPGKIIQSMRKAGTTNPVFLLDEIDKMSSDFRGDPSSAMLEVLDPEQNNSFNDHYLEVPYDLSQVLFIATANSLHTIPSPLRDRMEIIEIPGYSDIEKFQIATRFLIPKQLRENGLTSAKIRFRRDAVFSLIHDYTMESGVRSLERIIGTVVRKLARNYLSRAQKTTPLNEYTRTITAKNLPQLLGKPIYSDELVHKEPVPGLAHGLAWTEMGGRMLSVEAALFPGTGKLILTGNLGEVMKESARISLSYIQSHAAALSIDPEVIKHHDIHIHVPQGAIPKDGPSAGITLTVALYSALIGKAPNHFSMTGELTLTGNILAIGGVKEKILASYRMGIRQILLPAKNEKDVAEDIPRKVLEDLSIHYITHIQQALQLLFPDYCDAERCVISEEE